MRHDTKAGETKAEELKSETRDVKVTFSTEALEAVNLGEDGSAQQTFKDVDMNDYDAFVKTVTDYVNGKGYEVVKAGSIPESESAGTTFIVKKKEAPKPETRDVKVTFYTENLEAVDLGEDGTAQQTFKDVDMNDYEAFVKTVTDYVNGKGYEVVKAGELPSTESQGTIFIVKAKETPEPTPEQASSKVTIQFKFGDKVVKTQELTYTGEKNTTTIITKAIVESSWIPGGYQVKDYFADTTLTYGTDITLTVSLRLGGGSSSGGSSSGSGSASGSGSSGSAVVSGVLTNGEWILDNVGWWYSFSNGSYARNGWYTLEWRDRIDWYYFNADGYLISGWYTDAAGNRYYLHPEHDGTFGRMYTGWNKVEGKWQFFNDNMQQGVYGAWVENTPVPEELQNK